MRCSHQRIVEKITIQEEWLIQSEYQATLLRQNKYIHYYYCYDCGEILTDKDGRIANRHEHISVR